MKLSPLLLCALLVGCASQDASQQDPAENPKAIQTNAQSGESEEFTLRGEFAEIDVEKSQQAIDAIIAGQGDVINDVLKNPNDYVPQVLYLASAVMFDNDYQEQATFWFYVAQLRARSDANKSGDKTAHTAVGQLNQRFGERIAPFSLSNPELLENVVNQALQWDSEQARNYDARWIALQSKDVLTESKVAFAPEDKWQEIDALTRNQFRQSLEQALASAKQSNTQ